jgi:hypothetical protein
MQKGDGPLSQFSATQFLIFSAAMNDALKEQRDELNRILKAIKAGTYDIEANRDEIILLVKHAAWARLVAVDALMAYSLDYLYNTTKRNEAIPRAALPRISETGHKVAQEALLKMPELFQEFYSKENPDIKQFVNRMPKWRGHQK